MSQSGVQIVKKASNYEGPLETLNMVSFFHTLCLDSSFLLLFVMICLFTIQVSERVNCVHPACGKAYNTKNGYLILLPFLHSPSPASSRNRC